MKIFDTSRDIWFYIRDFLSPAEVENILGTGVKIWHQIFKDNSWLEYALTFDRCSPVLIGYELSAYRPGRSSNCLYLALVLNDYSGDLRHESQKFFAALRDGWEYDKDRHEIRFPFGLTLNVFDVIEGHEEIQLPLEKVFTNTRKGVYSQYCYYKNAAIKEIHPTDIMKWDPEYRSQPFTRGWWNGFGRRGRDIKYGCKFVLQAHDGEKTYVLLPGRVKSKIWAKMR